MSRCLAVVFWIAFTVGTAWSVASPSRAGNRDSDGPLQIAVAANFASCLEEILVLWEGAGHAPATVIVGSTGRHFAQINNGAPFDVFLAADADRPRRLEEENFAVPGSRFCYALGRLVLWAPGIEIAPDAAAADLLRDAPYHHLAIANPRLAPYGRAAQQFLEAIGVWDGLGERLVTGQSVGQTWQFVASGAAEAGLLALSQTKKLEDEHAVLIVPAEFYASIVQEAVLLERARDNEEATRFLKFLGTDEARNVIRAYGYGVPEDGAP